MWNQEHHLACPGGACTGSWEATAMALAERPTDEVAGELEQMDVQGRTELFRRLPASRRVHVYAALSPAKQNRELAEALAQLR